MNIKMMFKTLTALKTVSAIIAFGEQLKDKDFIFVNCHPQLIFTNGEAQLTVWASNLEEPKIAEYKLDEFFDEQGRKLQ